jgi:hypothetical protein
MELKKDYRIAVHAVKYGMGKRYSIVIGNNPFGPRGGTSGIIVDAAHKIDFHCSASHAHYMSIVIENVLVFMKKCNLQTMDFDYDKYHDSLKRKKVDKRIIKEIIFNEFLGYRETRFQLLIYMNKNK